MGKAKKKIASAKEAENFYNARLSEELRRLGFSTAGFERIFKVRKGAKELSSKPDVTFTNGGVHIISAKFGARKELEAYTTADQYKEDLAPVLERSGEKIGEVFAVTYAGKGEKYHLHVLPRPEHHEMSLTLETFEEVAAQIKIAVEGLTEDLAKRSEPVLEEARRLLTWGAEDVAHALRGVRLLDLETIFGGHDFFEALLKPRLKGEKREEALRLGAAYLFVNQVLFYVLLSRAAEKDGDPSLFPPINPNHFKSPALLQSEYFQRVRAKNYEPIYGFEVVQFFKGRGIEDACEEVVRSIAGLAPKLDVPDLVGQVFQSLIPFEIRKPLGAHYTNPRAAALLARLSIESAEDTVLDPACGSGTLLVASYQRKAQLARGRNVGSLHHRFVEKDITGIDVMAFSSHLAAVNLALQQPLAETDHVRIGTADSTGKHPGDLISTAEHALPSEFHQATLGHDFDKQDSKKKRGVVRTSSRDAKAIELDRVDLVIMNPPFTSWNNMAKAYRENLNMNFANERPEYRKILHMKTSQQVHFILLADRFLKPGGRLAAVLPLTTFTGHAFQPLVEYLLSHYSVEFIVVGLGRCAFSEDTSLTECLFIARKRPASEDSKFKLIGTTRSPMEWTTDDVETIAGLCMGPSSENKETKIRELPQADLSPENETLSGLMLRLDESFERAIESLDDILAQSKLKIIRVQDLMERGLRINEVYHGPDRPLKVGPKALLACRTEDRAIKAVDRLVLESDAANWISFRDRMSGFKVSFPRKDVSASLRRFSFLPSYDCTESTDFVVNTPSSHLEKSMAAFYTKAEARHFLSILRKGNRWNNIVHEYSSRLNIAARLDVAAPGTTLLACRSQTPVFLAGAYGYMLRGLEEKAEKLLCLWLNSSFSLVFLLSKATLTRGTWLKIEQYTTKQLPIPDPNRFGLEEWKQVERLWLRVSKKSQPSLVEQLEQDHRSRTDLDDGILLLLGFSDSSERKVLAQSVRTGLLRTIQALQKSMTEDEKPDEAEDE
jgi:hypothetical protein